MIDSTHIGLYSVRLRHDDRNAHTFGVLDNIVNKGVVNDVIVHLSGDEERNIKAVPTYKNESRRITTVRAPFIDVWLRANSTPGQDFSATLEIFPGGIHRYSQIEPIL